MLRTFTFTIRPTSFFIEKEDTTLGGTVGKEGKIFQKNLQLLSNLKKSEHTSKDAGAKKVYRACIARIEEIIRDNPVQPIIQKKILQEILNEGEPGDTNKKFNNLSTGEINNFSDISLKKAQGILNLFDILPELPHYIGTLKSIISGDRKVISDLVTDADPESRIKSHQLLIIANIIKNNLGKTEFPPVGGYRYINYHRDRLQRIITGFLGNNCTKEILDRFSTIAERYITDLYKIELGIHETNIPLLEPKTNHGNNNPNPQVFNISSLEDGQKLAITYARRHNEMGEVIDNGFIKIQEPRKDINGKIRFKISHDNEELGTISIDENTTFESGKTINFPEIGEVCISKVEFMGNYQKKDQDYATEDPENMVSSKVFTSNQDSKVSIPDSKEVNIEKEVLPQGEKKGIIPIMKTGFKKAWSGMKRFLGI